MIDDKAPPLGVVIEFKSMVFKIEHVNAIPPIVQLLLFLPKKLSVRIIKLDVVMVGVGVDVHINIFCLFVCLFR